MARITLLSLILLLLASTLCSYEIIGNIGAELTLDQSGTLAEIFAENNLKAEYALLIAADGIAVFISERSFPYLRIDRDRDFFFTRSEYLPPVSNLNDLVEIAVFITASTPVDKVSPFTKRLQQFEFLGESSRDGHFIRKYRALNTR